MLFIKNLIGIAVKDLVAKKMRFILTLIGIVAGVACLLFLLGLTMGINKHIRKELVGTIPVTEMSALPRIEIDRRVIIDPGITLDNAMLEKVKKLPGVKTVYGIQTLSAIPTTIKGNILWGMKDFTTDNVIFGIPRELLINDLKHPEQYRYDPKLKIQKIDVPPGTDKDERWDIYMKFIKQYAKEYGEVPVVISKVLFEVYNISFAGKGRAFPQLTEDVFIGQKLFLQFESSEYLDFESKDRRGVACRVIGFSTRAPMMGIAVPPEYVHDWQKYHLGEKTEIEYRKFIIIAKTPSDVDQVTSDLKKMGFTVRTSQETIDKINTATNFIGLGFTINGLLILFIASVSIVNVLMLSVNEEAVEIGILRSVGARKSQIRIIYLTKAAFIGFIGGLEGILFGLIAIALGNRIALHYLENQPYMPDNFFHVTFLFALGCFVLGFIFSLLAGILPANRAASLNPAQVLRQG